MFGLGINIYSGEDLPLSENDFLSEEEKEERTLISLAYLLHLEPVTTSL
jgi:hypothetical protein